MLGGPEEFGRTFGLILADRGAEFSDVAGIERGGRCSAYFTDSMCAGQKGACERGHVELRKIIPEGTPIDGLRLDPWLMAGICSHTDSNLRLSIGDESPARSPRRACQGILLDGPGVGRIAPEDAETRPELMDRLRAERSRTAGA